MIKRPVDSVKLIIALVTTAVFVFLGIIFLMVDFLVGAIVCFCLAAVYLMLALKNMQIVIISREQVELKFFWITRRVFLWDEIEEVGICGTKVLKPKDSRRSGAKYYYFSETVMTEDERFEMCLRWPPKDKIFLRFDEKLKKMIIKYSPEELVLYNAGKTVLYDE